MVRHGLPRRLAPWMPLRAHQPPDVVAADRLAGPEQRLPGAPVAVGEVVGRVHLPDPLEQPLILDDSLGALPGGALVVGGRRHVQGPADRLDAEAAAVLIDVAAHLVRSSSSSFAKNTEADFKISFARRNSKFSARNRRISSRSWLLGRSGRAPESASCWRTFLRNVSGCIPRSAAICAIGRSLSNAKPDAALHQLIGVLLRSGHENGRISFRQDIIPASKPPSNPAWLTRPAAKRCAPSNAT